MSFAYIPVRRRTIKGVTDVRRGCSLEASGLLRTAEMRKGEKRGEIESARKRDGDNRDLSNARQREEKERGRGGLVGEVTAPTGTGEASYVQAGGKEQPEEWIEDVRRPVHHLCRPTGIAAGVPCSVAGWWKREKEKEREEKRGKEIPIGGRGSVGLTRG